MAPSRSLWASIVASVGLHVAVLLLCSLVVWRSQVGSWVAFTDITVIGESPLGEGLGKKNPPASVGPSAIASQTTKPVKVEKPQTVQLPTADRGPTADQLTSIRAAFPIGNDLVSPQSEPTSPIMPIGYGEIEGRPGVPWGDAGASGHLAQRAILRQVLPQYPAWAKEQGISARIEVGIWVTPEGRVRERIDVLKKSGYKELDEVVVTAVKQWAFKPLPPVMKQEDQYGIVPIRFALNK